eukprot:gene19049-25649_t
MTVSSPEFSEKYEGCYEVERMTPEERLAASRHGATAVSLASHTTRSHPISNSVTAGGAATTE